MRRDGSGLQRRETLLAAPGVRGRGWVSARLNEGTTDVKGDWQEQVEADMAPLLAAGTPVWLRADNAYYCGVLAAFDRERGWASPLGSTELRR